MQQWTSRGVFRKFCLLVGASALLPMALCGAEKSDTVYQELARRAAKGDLSIDFRTLRLACAQADHCDAAGDSKDVIAMRRAAQSKDFPEAVKMAEKLIAAGFPNIEAHAVCAEAYQELGETDKASLQHDITAALIRSIMETGDGRKKETAFEVMGVSEEHIVLSILGLPPFGKQSLISGRPHSFDVIEVDDPKSGQKVSVFFRIDAFFPMKGLH